MSVLFNVLSNKVRLHGQRAFDCTIVDCLYLNINKQILYFVYSDNNN